MLNIQDKLLLSIEEDDDRPYFPKIGVLLGYLKGLAISFKMMRDIEEEGYKWIEMLVNFIEQNKLMPAKSLVVREETYYLYLDMCKQLVLPLEIVEYLGNADNFRSEMFNHMMDT